MNINVGITSVLRRYYVGVAHRRVAAACALMVLSACASPPQGPPSFRDQGTIIASSTRFDVERFWGKWQVRAAFPGQTDLQTVALIPDTRGGLVWRETRQRCKGTVCALDQTDRLVREAGTGRLDLLGSDTGDLWVLWVDADFRTAAIGTPDGRFGYVLDRRKTGGADRLKAAREVLDFNGYDISQLQVIR